MRVSLTFKGITEWISSLLVKTGKKNNSAQWIIFFVIVSPVLVVAVYNYVTTYQEFTQFTETVHQLGLYGLVLNEAPSQNGGP